MASTITKLLVPVGSPSALANEQVMPVPGQDLFTNYVMNVHAIPAEIDLDRFQAALSKTLARYPSSAGRLKREGDDWKILLTNDPVPVVVVRLNPADAEARRENYPFPNDFIIHDSTVTQPFLNTEDVTTFILRGDATEVLLAFKLTYWERGTVIGITWNHTLGEAKPLYDLTCCLSALYEDIDAPEDKLPLAPSFYRHFFPLPWRPGATTENMMPRMPHLAQDYNMTDLLRKYAEAEAASDHVQMRFPEATLLRMQQAAKDGEDIFLTPHDALSAYLVTVFNRCYDKPMLRVINAINYRSAPKDIATAATFTHPAACTNGILMMYSDFIPDNGLTSIAAIARVIRKSINEARQPDFVEKWHTFASYLLAKGANASKEGRLPYFPPEDQETTINSNYRYDWTSAHFGHPGGAKFYTSWTALNFFRIFTANPHGKPSGDQKLAEANVSGRIMSDRSAKFIEIVKKDHPDTIVEGQ